MRGELTKVSLEDSGVVSKHSSSAALTQKYIDSLSLDLLDDECVESAKVMATVYTAIAAFENMVRQFVVKILMENKGENWWTECVSDKIRKSADSRKAEEDKIKWHTHRGTSMINYVDFRSSSEFPFAFAPSSFLLYCVPADQYFRSKILL